MNEQTLPPALALIVDRAAHRKEPSDDEIRDAVVEVFGMFVHACATVERLACAAERSADAIERMTEIYSRAVGPL